MSESSQKAKSLRDKSLGIAGSIFGLAVGQYAGFSLLIPLSFTAIVWWLATKLLPEPKRLVIPAFAVQCGHGLWMLLGLILIGSLDANTLDVLLLGGGLAWLLAKPGPGPLYLLGAYQLFSVLYNGYAFYGAQLGSTLHKALLVHVVWRFLALVFIVQAVVKLRRNADTPVASDQSPHRIPVGR